MMNRIGNHARFKSIVIGVFVLLIALSLTACVQQPPSQGSIGLEIDPITQQEPSIDSLLATIMRPSKMELPMLWTDTIYDTCFTYRSADGKYNVFVGRTKEDKLLKDDHITPYGLVSFEERQSVFFYDNEKSETKLLLTTSPRGHGLYMPQIDVENELIYYLREGDYTGRNFMRYNFRTNEEECLTGCFYTTVYKLMYNGHILFQDVREDVVVSDTSLLDEGESSMMGYVFCDVEMTPEGICVNKSQYYYYENMDSKTGKTHDVSWTHILNNDKYKPRWNQTNIGDFNDFYDKKGCLVGSTNNCIESYDGWKGLKTKK